MALQNIRRKGAAAAAVLGLGALLVGCSREGSVNGAQLTGTTAGAPLAVSCEPNQRAVVRQAAVNGGVQAQVQCETVAGFGGTSPAVSPVAYQSGYQPVSYGYTQPAPAEPTRLVRAAYPQEVVTREVAPRRVVYQRAPERIYSRPKRSVQKSAIIIGSSAGVGAGIGAAVGGKKGAGIGALIGGGGAALWDQITRHKQ
jgi:hypothetical protein